MEMRQTLTPGKHEFENAAHCPSPEISGEGWGEGLIMGALSETAPIREPSAAQPWQPAGF